MNKILVTDSLFIFDEHIDKLEKAGYETERLNVPKAHEEELIAALKGKVGYILGGIEKVTDKVLESADELKAVVFTGTAWDGFILGQETAKKKGIKIANTPHLNATAVAEWAFSSGVAMVRNLFALGRTGDKSFQTSPGFADLKVGVIGLGHVGQKAAELFSAIGADVSYWSEHQKNSPFRKKDLGDVLGTSDLILVCVSSAAGDGWLNKELLSKVKNGAIITCMTDSVLNEEDLLVELSRGRLRAYLDWTPKLEGYKSLPLDIFYSSNESTAYNTRQANQAASDAAVNSLINLLQSGEDKYRVL